MFRKLCAVMLVILLIVAVAGYFRGWFAISGHGGGSDGNKVDVHLSVDPDKMKADAEAVKQKASELTTPATTQPSEATGQK